MICKKCNHANENDVRICQSCGEELIINSEDQIFSKSEAAAAFEQGQQIGVQERTYRSESTQETFNSDRTKEYVEKSKEVSKMYFGYFWEVLKSPNTISYRKNKADLTNGLITVVLFTLLYVLASFTMVNRYMNAVTFFGESLYKVSFFDGFISPFIGLLLLSGLIGVLLYGMQRYYKQQVDIVDVLTKWFSYLVVPTALSALGFVFAVVGITQVAGILLGFAMAAIFAIIPLYLNHVKAENGDGLDTLYSTLIIYAVIMIVLSISGNAIFNSVLNTIL